MVKAQVYMVSVIDFINYISQTIFKMLLLEQSVEKWPFSTWGGGRPTAPTPPPPLQRACASGRSGINGVGLIIEAVAYLWD